ncbi:hypothetical protein [Nannocystis pusilla]|uniref:hypothetical protein n=1 Tax=Nannocystis pusilla TaxID=889268 RepID=UPI003B810CA5
MVLEVCAGSVVPVVLVVVVGSEAVVPVVGMAVSLSPAVPVSGSPVVPGWRPWSWSWWRWPAQW